ncbi:hypothetical protein D3C78_1442340 [compost metagenome]
MVHTISVVMNGIIYSAARMPFLIRLSSPTKCITIIRLAGAIKGIPRYSTLIQKLISSSVFPDSSSAKPKV